MTEQELIDTINELIDADVQAHCPALRSKDIARRAIERCGEGVFEAEVDAYRAWLRECGDQLRAGVRELEREAARRSPKEPGQ